VVPCGWPWIRPRRPPAHQRLASRCQGGQCGHRRDPGVLLIPRQQVWLRRFGGEAGSEAGHSAGTEAYAAASAHAAAGASAGTGAHAHAGAYSAANAGAHACAGSSTHSSAGSGTSSSTRSGPCTYGGRDACTSASPGTCSEARPEAGGQAGNSSTSTSSTSPEEVDGCEEQDRPGGRLLCLYEADGRPLRYLRHFGGLFPFGLEQPNMVPSFFFRVEKTTTLL